MMRGKHSEETKQKMSKAQIGKHHSEATKQLLSVINMGKKLSRETRMKMSKNRKGKKHWNWKGGIQKTLRNKIIIYCPDHPRAYKNYVYEHILMAEKILGKYLPEKAVVHHINRDGTDNNLANLVVCQDQGFHLFLHKRMKERKEINDDGIQGTLFKH